MNQEDSFQAKGGHAHGTHTHTQRERERERGKRERAEIECQPNDIPLTDELTALKLLLLKH